VYGHHNGREYPGAVPRARGGSRPQGQIERRGNSLRVRVYAGMDPLTGRRLYLRESTTDEAEAKRILTRLRAQVDEQRNARTSALFRVALEEWLKVHELEESTRVGYELYIRRYIKPALGGEPVSKIAPVPLVQHHARALACSDSQGADRAHQGATGQVEWVPDQFAKRQLAPRSAAHGHVAVDVQARMVQGHFVRECFVRVDGVEEPHGAELEVDDWQCPVKTSDTETQPVLEQSRGGEVAHRVAVPPVAFFGGPQGPNLAAR
jgi:hypothetical protein